ncbi:hypothetical protein BD410DRAFT_901458 [Rickenella mellea]|uniref:Uncharacterized protein n=1 Tax=Rickenella mellea TaxID=50990 RepID=A0A4Y7PQQ2_9AGAM|nr:hypothetical protein BD410DRAFT_901458 [Rickenella mellea]
MAQTPINQTIDRLVSVLSSIKNNNWVIGGEEPFRPDEPGGSASSNQDFEEGQLLQLRYLKLTGDALHVMLHSVDSGIHALQAPCVAIALQRGIHSIPDDILAHIFEVGYHSCDDQGSRDSHHFSVAVSHVSRRFRMVALRTPRIWTRLSNWMKTSQLETFSYRSKAADLIITATTDEYDDPNISLEAFLAITLPSHSRWSEFTYDILEHHNLFPQAILSQTRNLTFPRLRSLGCVKAFSTDGDDGVLPEHTFATWEMPALIHFHGVSASIEGKGIGKNVQSAEFFMDYSIPDYRSIFHELGSWPHLTTLNFEFSNFYSDIEPSKVSLQTLRTLVIIAEFDADGVLLGKVLSLLDMPVLSNVSLEIHRDVVSVDELIEGMWSATTRCRSLTEFTLDTTAFGEHGFRFGVLGMFVSKLSFLETVTFRGAGLYGIEWCPRPPLWQLFHFEGATPDDIHRIGSYAHILCGHPKFKLRMGKCNECKEISRLKRSYQDRLEYEANENAF